MTVQDLYKEYVAKCNERITDANARADELRQRMRASVDPSEIIKLGMRVNMVHAEILAYQRMLMDLDEIFRG